MGDEVGDRELRRLLEASRDSVLAGQPWAKALAGFPELAPPEVVRAFSAGEANGVLPEQMFRIAAAVEAGDLSTLTAAAPKKGAARQRR